MGTMNHETPHTPDMPNLPKIEVQPEGFEYIADLTNRQLENIRLHMEVYVAKPNSKHEKVLKRVIANHTESVKHALEMYGQEFTEGTEAFRALSYYIFGLEQRRVELLNEFELEDVKFDVTNNGDVESSMYINEDDDGNPVDFTPEDAVILTHSYYAHRFSEHTELLGKASREVYEGTSKAKYASHARRIGGHALDVAKIAVGVAAGVAIAKKAKVL